jgi:hypothetical protein
MFNSVVTALAVTATFGVIADCTAQTARAERADFAIHHVTVINLANGSSARDMTVLVAGGKVCDVVNDARVL